MEEDRTDRARLVSPSARAQQKETVRARARGGEEKMDSRLSDRSKGAPSDTGVISVVDSSSVGLPPPSLTVPSELSPLTDERRTTLDELTTREVD